MTNQLIDRQLAIDALSKAKIQLMARPDSAFFTTICFSLKHSFDASIPTACTNGKWIKFGTKFFMDLSPEERVFLLLHETMHCAYLHMVRLPTGACPDKWNIATDHVINLQLIERGFKMPKMGLADPQYKGLSAEEVYKLLPENPGQPQMQDLVHGEDPGASMCDGAGAEALSREMADILVRAAVQSRVSGDKPGTIPGEIEIFLNRLLNPKLPWNRILQKYLQAFAKNDYTFRKPNRRFFPKYHLPSLFSENLMNIAVAVDTSGSVTDEQFLRFVTETHSIMRMMKPEKITLIQFDTEIKATNEIKSIQELMKVHFTGRGGTLINPVLEWANVNKPQLLLVFSDGGFYFYSQVTKVPTIWLIHDNKQFNAPFGKTIHYAMED
jgi:predicted metal-dependent peptidase